MSTTEYYHFFSKKMQTFCLLCSSSLVMAETARTGIEILDNSPPFFPMYIGEDVSCFVGVLGVGGRTLKRRGRERRVENSKKNLLPLTCTVCLSESSMTFKTWCPRRQEETRSFELTLQESFNSFVAFSCARLDVVVVVRAPLLFFLLLRPNHK